jgi:hypothetical protein
VGITFSGTVVWLVLIPVSSVIRVVILLFVPNYGYITLVVESQLYSTGDVVSFDAYTIGKLPNHKGR